MTAENAIAQLRHQVEAGELGIDGPPMPRTGEHAGYREQLNAAKMETALNWTPDWLTILVDVQFRLHPGWPGGETSDDIARQLLKESARGEFVKRAVARGVPEPLATMMSDLIWLTEPGCVDRRSATRPTLVVFAGFANRRSPNTVGGVGAGKMPPIRSSSRPMPS